MTEAETIFVKIGLEVLLGKTMINTQDKDLGIADYDIQPAEQTRVGIIELMLMDKAL